MAENQSKKTKPTRAGMLTTTQAARLLMVTDQWIRDLSKKGYIPAPDGGFVPLVETVQGYIRWLKDEERRTSKTAAASAVQQARADEIRLRIAREQGRLIELEDTEAAFADIFGLWRNELEGLPRAVTRDLCLRSSIEGYIEAMCSRLQARFRARRDEIVAKAKK